MGRAKPKPPDEPLPDRLKEEEPPKPKKAKQGFLAIVDENGKEAETLAPSEIPELTKAAEEYREQKIVRQGCKEKEDELRDKLKEVLTENIGKLGPSKIYTYVDDNDEKREVKFEEPGVTVRKVKQKKTPKTESGFINPDGETAEDMDGDDE